MAYSFKGSITFGLVYIPVTLHAAVKPEGIGFNMLEKKTLSRVRYKKTCEECDGREIENADIVKGYEYDDGRYVVFTEEELKRLKTKKDQNITIEKFVDLSEIDPIYFDRSYYVVPTGADNAFTLLTEAMEQEGKAGIAKTVLGSKEVLMALRVRKGQMLINTLFFQEDIQANPVAERKSGGKTESKASELKVAKSIIAGMTGEFRPEEYRDEYRERVRRAVGQKIAGKRVTKVKETSARPVADLMEALQASLKATASSKKPSKEKTLSPRRPAAARKKKSAK